jgi:hypothetical protein
LAVVDRKGQPAIAGGTGGESNRLTEGANEFLNSNAAWLSDRLHILRWEIDVEWLGVEGYYASGTRMPVRMCDADLPMDMAFQARQHTLEL